MQMVVINKDIQIIKKKSHKLATWSKINHRNVLSFRTGLHTQGAVIKIRFAVTAAYFIFVWRTFTHIRTDALGICVISDCTTRVMLTVPL